MMIINKINNWQTANNDPTFPLNYCDSDYIKKSLNGNAKLRDSIFLIFIFLFAEILSSFLSFFIRFCIQFRFLLLFIRFLS